MKRRLRKQRENELLNQPSTTLQSLSDTEQSPKKTRIPTREQFFMEPCGFDKLAAYLSTHGVASDETPQPAVDGNPVEVEGDNTGVDLCPYTVMETSPLSKVHFMFAVMGLSHVWVLREGRLMGMVAKEDLMNMEKE